MSLAKLLSLDKPLVLIDLETTIESHFNRNRIVQIALIKIYPDGKETTWETLVNPSEDQHWHISQEATDVHGIQDVDVAGAPTFHKIASVLLRGMEALPYYCYIGGYNVRFDMNVLDYSFARIGASDVFDPDNYMTLDAFDIFRHFNPRGLKAAVRHYTGKELDDAHQAAADIAGTKRVLEAQLSAEWHMGDLPSSVSEINEIVSKRKGDPDKIDRQGKFKWMADDPCAAFGTHEDLPMNMIPNSYWVWMLNNDFSPSTKRVVRAALRGEFPKR